ncbi:hypothetical protein [Shewanella sp. ALD9]|jgi:hypothetical protein|uniref:hypothetical protein n=1 Tax=Shewanella sp. ALD9 TaxID=2058330 RepID=UPI000C3439D5|nr:hypothetical protein [Shewanella sp. ALD9]PKH31457.1 hypothetical protein CXF88_12970 [Shewanella sp. ALD9]
MKLQTLKSLEDSIGGRPKTLAPKQRHTFYLNPKESKLLKAYARDKDICVSQLVRNLIKELVEVNT